MITTPDDRPDKGRDTTGRQLGIRRLWLVVSTGDDVATALGSGEQQAPPLAPGLAVDTFSLMALVRCGTTASSSWSFEP
jgi:hypothetical protein